MINSINNRIIFTYIPNSKYTKNIHINIDNIVQDTKLKLQNYNKEKNNYYDQLDTIIDNNNLIQSSNISLNKKESLNDIKQLINSYNDTLHFFNKNKSLSQENMNIYTALKEITYPPLSYESIGIQIDINGKLRINENKLINAINNTPNTVNNILTGLMNSTNNQLNIINSQYDKLFPEIQKTIGNEMLTTSFYTSGAYLQAASYINLGNIINFCL